MFNRRNFLKGAGALSFAGSMSTLSALNNSRAYAADITGYKALVCMFFHGGQDGHDLVLPYDQASYDRYAEIRSSMINSYPNASRARSNLLPLNPVNAGQLGGRQYALPAELAPIKSLFDSGNAAILSNVGPLIEPATRTQIENSSVILPERLYSHNDQQSTWMSSAPQGAQAGWGGGFADQVLAANANNSPEFTAISVSGNSVFLTGNQALQYQAGLDGAAVIGGLEDGGLLGAGANSSLAQTLIVEHFRTVGARRANLFQQDYVDGNNRALDSNALYNSSLANSTPLQTVFPGSRVGQEIEAIANTINIRNELGMRRQVFFVGYGGFDSHSNQANNLPNRQNNYAEAIAAFYSAMQEMGIANDVTLFTASDFGRTLVINGDGTDHGWGSNHLIIGGAVNGNAIYGTMPPYDLGHEQDDGGGRLIPTTSVEQYAATLGSWFGLDAGELAASLPNLSNFSPDNLGFI